MISIKILNSIQYFLLFIFQNYILKHFLEPKLYIKAVQICVFNEFYNQRKD